jgi:hypothetical protein
MKKALSGPHRTLKSPVRDAPRSSIKTAPTNRANVPRNSYAALQKHA